MQVGRYHSLIVTPTPAMADQLAIDAAPPEGEIMALGHRSHPTYGIQFHPESVLTQGGHELFANFLGLAEPGGDSPGPGPTPMLWIDGRLHEGTHVPFDLSDRGLLLGDGVFDTAMALGGRIAFEEEHVGRLAAAAETLGFTIDRDRVVAGMRALAARIPRAAIRTTVTRGTGPRGLAPPAAAAPVHWASAAPLMPGLAFATLSLMPVAIRRNETSPSARLKTLGYLDAVMGNREARAAGFDESLFLNLQGRVACAAHRQPVPGRRRAPSHAGPGRGRAARHRARSHPVADRPSARDRGRGSPAHTVAVPDGGCGLHDELAAPRGEGHVDRFEEYSNFE